MTITSVMMSLWPGGGWSGPRFGVSSLLEGAVRGLFGVSTMTSVPSTTRELRKVRLVLQEIQCICNTKAWVLY